MICVFFHSYEQLSKPGHVNPDVQRQTAEFLLTGTHPPAECCLKPDFIRLAPPLHSCEDEVGSPFLIRVDVAITVLILFRFKF